MSIACPPRFDLDHLREQVAATHMRVAERPGAGLHFHTGGEYAIDLLGYPCAEAEALPRLATDRFASLGSPLRIAPVPASAIVLDHVCGARIQWLESFVVAGANCRVFFADSETLIAVHARHSGFPADRVVDVRATIDPSTAAA